MNSTRWFDENGKEIIRGPGNPDGLEPIAEIGGVFEEFIVCLNFCSNKLDKDEITRLVGAEPTKSWNPRERRPVGNSNKTMITDFGKWYLTSKRDSRDLNVILKDLLNSITNDLEKWKTLTSKYDTWIDVAGFMENWNRGFTLKPEIMKLLFDRNLAVVFDIYFDGEDYDESE